MTFDPDEFVTLTDHGTMKLRSAVSRAMTLLPKERMRATIVRDNEPATLTFKQIKVLAAQWDERSGTINRRRKKVRPASRRPARRRPPRRR